MVKYFRVCLLGEAVAGHNLDRARGVDDASQRFATITKVLEVILKVMKGVALAGDIALTNQIQVPPR